jgi:hypothetical protein
MTTKLCVNLKALDLIFFIIYNLVGESFGF